MKTRLLVVASVLGLSVALAACGGPSVTSGKVIDKTYTAAYNQPYVIMVGKVPVTEEEYVAADWSIELKDGEQTGWIDVSQSTYDHEHNGDQYTVPGSKTQP